MIRWLRSRPAASCQTAYVVTLYLVFAIVLRAGGQTATPDVSHPAEAKGNKFRPSPSANPWAPPDIDEVIPPTNPQPCPLPEILQGVGQRTKELVESLKSFSATETLDYVELNKNGRPGQQRKAEVDYVADFRDVGRDTGQIQEYRNGTKAFPVASHVAVSGTVTAALIFHPAFVGNFKVECEGMSMVRGVSAWQVHFVQSPGTPDFRSYNVNGTWYSVMLKGRAWIAADTYQVLRLEHDIALPVPKIRLLRDYVAVDYATVDFPRHGVQLWLPQRSLMYIDFGGQRYKLAHDFANFKLFWVDTEQELKGKKSRTRYVATTSEPEGPWPPPDIDEFVPPTKPQPCPLPEILKGVGERTEELVTNLKSFSATETLNYIELLRDGQPGIQKRTEVSYVAEFREVGKGMAQIEEYRNDKRAFPFPSTLAVSGTVTAGLIFHPTIVRNFAIECEGLGEANGRSAWQLHFVQLPGTADFRSYNVHGTWYSVTLKGRAWIAADNHQVLRLEHDLAQTVPGIRLLRDYVAVDYDAVDFPRRGVQMWLPQRSRMYIEYGGRRYTLKHDFAKFKLFWVDTEQELNLPK